MRVQGRRTQKCKTRSARLVQASGFAVFLIAVSCAAGARAQAPGAGEADPEPIEIATHAMPAGKNASEAEPCFPVETIRITGAHTLLQRELIVEKVEPHAVACQGNASVSSLLEGINGLFAERGFVTTQAWLPEQDIAATKTLTLNIVPGRIDKIVYEEEREPWRWFAPRMAGHTVDLFEATGPGDLVTRTGVWWNALDDDFDRFTLLPSSARIAMARTVKNNEILQIDSLQGTLDALNRVPSHEAEAGLDPGSRPATTEVRIKNRVDDAFRLYAGYDNKSASGIDRLRFGVTAEKDNLIGINDTWSLTLRSDIDSNELSGNVSVPVGNLTFRGAADWSESTTEPLPLIEYFVPTWNVSGGIDWTVQASKTRRTTLDLTLKHREQDRYVNGLELAGGQRVTALSGGISYSRFYERGSLSGRIGIEAGLPILNANRDADDIDAFTPRSQFVKLEGLLSANYAFPQKASLSSTVTWQWTDDPLFSDDQITIGSVDTVRGYSEGFMKADSGFVWRNEVAFAVPAQLLISGEAPAADWGRTMLSRFNPYLFLDGGLGRDNANDITGYRVSTGLGIRYGGPALSYDLGYAFRLAEDNVTTTDDGSGELFVNLRLKLF